MVVQEWRMVYQLIRRMRSLAANDCRKRRLVLVTDSVVRQLFCYN